MVTELSMPMQALVQASIHSGFAVFTCRACAHRFYPPQSFCPACLASEVEPVVDSGEATVLSTTRLHRSLEPTPPGGLPLHVACVATAAGPTLFAVADRLLPVGARVRIRLRDGLFHAETCE